MAIANQFKIFYDIVQKYNYKRRIKIYKDSRMNLMNRYYETLSKLTRL